ncbi:ChaC-like protein [Polychaeton citri CBS 116435]|uniref:glutathione-specific gamma-glutamylcyclotransferase n=1 Tax=Polychaeton citri CBS 116435 TaxID=1314669 RepID=A0A9P4QC74_9PEZI|nr:ChaC-like protein [Polychaeton citri CBS 116435]
MGEDEPPVEDLWLFGYGSLIWKPPPHYDLRVPGYIEGYVRRFWQVSEDHRGTPEAPGRVVTLIDRQLWETLTDQHAIAPPRVWGAAYRIPSLHVAEVTEYLNIREINGYSIQYTPFKRPDDITLTDQTVRAAPDDAGKTHPDEIPNCLVYIGLPDNPQFLGPQDPQALAEHIVKSRGPSGENKDYLYQLEVALDELSKESHDDHIKDLAGRCRAVEAKLDQDGG